MLADGMKVAVRLLRAHHLGQFIMRYLTPPVIRQRVFPKLAGRHIESNGR